MVILGSVVVLGKVDIKICLVFVLWIFFLCLIRKLCLNSNLIMLVCVVLVFKLFVLCSIFLSCLFCIKWVIFVIVESKVVFVK